MPSLNTLPTEIIQEIVRYLNDPPFGYASRRRRFHPKDDSLSLATVSKRIRGIIFDKTWVIEHVMEFNFGEATKTQRLIGLSVRNKVESLILRGSCESREARPTLLDYVELFPNVKSILIDLVYPYDQDRPGFTRLPSSTLNGQYTSVAANPWSKNRHHLKAVSLSLTHNIEYSGTTHERFTTNIVPQIKTKLQQIGIDKLDSYRLDFATSRTRQDRRRANFWGDFERRIQSACTIPAKEVFLDFREIRIDGEIERFLDAIRGGIKVWPCGIHSIKLVVPTDDYLHTTNTRDKYKVEIDGRVTLVEGWIPTEKNMMAFLQSVLQDRPDLKRFNLAIKVRNGSIRNRQVFGFDYIANDNSALNVDDVQPSWLASGSEELSEALGACALAAGKTSDDSGAQHSFLIDDAVVKVLYDALLEPEQLAMNRNRALEDFDEFEYDMQAYEAAADERYGVLSDDDGENMRILRWVFGGY